MNISRYILVLLLSSLYSQPIWSLEIVAENSSDIPITMGYCDEFCDNTGYCQECSDGLNYGLEDQTDGLGGLLNQGYTNLYFYNYSWLGSEIFDDYPLSTPYFNQDLKSTHPPEDLLTWNIGGSCDQDLGDYFTLTWQLDTLHIIEDYPIYLYVNEDYPMNMRLFDSKQIHCNKLQADNYNNSKIKVLFGGCAGTPLETYYQDIDGDGLGAGVPSEFCIGSQPNGWINNGIDINDTLYCESNEIDDCNACDGNGVEEACDCIDTSGLNENECCDDVAADCQGICGGTIELDPCGECGGTGVLEACECNDTSGLNGDGCCDDVIADCNGECNGSAAIDECGTCQGDCYPSTIGCGDFCDCGENIYDCFGECGGEASIDFCGDCNGANLGCLGDVFGDGPTDLYAQINHDANQINLSWLYNDINSEVVGYNIYQQIENENNLLDILNNANTLYHSISGFVSGTFCIAAFDLYGNETEPICSEASDFMSFDMTFVDGANLISFPCLPANNADVVNLFNSIEPYIDDIIGEGVAASFSNGDGWIGNISEIERRRGYWLKLNIEGEPGVMDCDNQSCISFNVTGIATDHNIIYTLHEGANLISYIGPDGLSISDAIPDGVEVYAIIGQGEAATKNLENEWMGNLTHFYNGRGYWIKVPTNTLDFDFIWNPGSSD